jgi:hypothetical protein
MPATTLPIPKARTWDIFQATLQSKVKRLAKEVAATLGEPEQPLLKALLNEKVAAYLFEEEGSEMIELQERRCKHIQPTPEDAAVLRVCRQPVILGKTACLHHELRGSLPLSSLPCLAGPEGRRWNYTLRLLTQQELVREGRVFKVVP